MSEKHRRRLDALKDGLSSTLARALETEAPVSYQGAGFAPPESGVVTQEKKETDSLDNGRAAEASPAPIVAQEVAVSSSVPSDADDIAQLASRLLAAPGEVLGLEDVTPKLEPRFVPVATHQWEKLSITLERRDLEVLERFHVVAREAGVKLRRGGNPSLFIRAALRELEELRVADPAAFQAKLLRVSGEGNAVG